MAPIDNDLYDYPRPRPGALHPGDSCIDLSSELNRSYPDAGLSMLLGTLGVQPYGLGNVCPETQVHDVVIVSLEMMACPRNPSNIIMGISTMDLRRIHQLVLTGDLKSSRRFPAPIISHMYYLSDEGSGTTTPRPPPSSQFCERFCTGVESTVDLGALDRILDDVVDQGRDYILVTSTPAAEAEASNYLDHITSRDSRKPLAVLCVGSMAPLLRFPDPALGPALTSALNTADIYRHTELGYMALRMALHTLRVPHLDEFNPGDLSGYVIRALLSIVVRCCSPETTRGPGYPGAPGEPTPVVLQIISMIAHHSPFVARDGLNNSWWAVDGTKLPSGHDGDFDGADRRPADQLWPDEHDYDDPQLESRWPSAHDTSGSGYSPDAYEPPVPDVISRREERRQEQEQEQEREDHSQSIPGQQVPDTEVDAEEPDSGHEHGGDSHGPTYPEAAVNHDPLYFHPNRFLRRANAEAEGSAARQDTETITAGEVANIPTTFDPTDMVYACYPGVGTAGYHASNGIFTSVRDQPQEEGSGEDVADLEEDSEQDFEEGSSEVDENGYILRSSLPLYQQHHTDVAALPPRLSPPTPFNDDDSSNGSSTAPGQDHDHGQGQGQGRGQREPYRHPATPNGWVHIATKRTLTSPQGYYSIFTDWDYDGLTEVGWSHTDMHSTLASDLEHRSPPFTPGGDALFLTNNSVMTSVVDGVVMYFTGINRGPNPTAVAATNTVQAGTANAEFAAAAAAAATNAAANADDDADADADAVVAAVLFDGEVDSEENVDVPPAGGRFSEYDIPPGLWPRRAITPPPMRQYFPRL
ncbi:hypothetical protein GMORB2_6129 [Geosmithia morbida]|uniref:Uncharacterized protein n=1 Tax=Geosmithia morbida TaxID=1094350 RepID=A0A9P4YUN4_9HYPO|nr:uncharacterized protein GMORB2_6129 [Geosmithia morbida]KAF4123428.1 hypothetical protein GMORB2_6129 [Geosmithia morbida]